MTIYTDVLYNSCIYSPPDDGPERAQKHVEDYNNVTVHKSPPPVRIDLAQDRDRWWAVMNVATNLWVT
jgi:hypothetical protein